MNKFIKKFKYRLELLILSSVSKKFSWAMFSTYLLWVDKINQDTWMLFAGAMLGLGTLEKTQGIKPKMLKEEED